MPASLVKYYYVTCSPLRTTRDADAHNAGQRAVAVADALAMFLASAKCLGEVPRRSASAKSHVHLEGT